MFYSEQIRGDKAACLFSFSYIPHFIFHMFSCFFMCFICSLIFHVFYMLQRAPCIPYALSCSMCLICSQVFQVFMQDFLYSKVFHGFFAIFQPYTVRVRRKSARDMSASFPPHPEIASFAFSVSSDASLRASAAVIYVKKVVLSVFSVAMSRRSSVS